MEIEILDLYIDGFIDRNFISVYYTHEISQQSLECLLIHMFIYKII